MITINGKKYPVKFGYSVIRRFAIEHGMPTMNDFGKWVSTLDTQHFETLQHMCELFLLGIVRGCEAEKTDCDLNADDIFDLLGTDIEAINSLTEILRLSLEGMQQTQGATEQGTKKKKKH